MKPQVSQLLGQAIKTRMTQNYRFKRKKPCQFSDLPLRRRQVPPSWRLRRGATCRRTARFVMALKSSCLVMQLIRSIEPSNINFADESVTSLQHRNSRAPTNILVSHCSHSHLEETQGIIHGRAQIQNFSECLTRQLSS